MTEASLRLANGRSNHDSRKYNNLNFRRPVVQLHMCAVFTITMSECPTRTCRVALLLLVILVQNSMPPNRISI